MEKGVSEMETLREKIDNVGLESWTWSKDISPPAIRGRRVDWHLWDVAFFKLKFYVARRCMIETQRSVRDEV